MNVFAFGEEFKFIIYHLLSIIANATRLLGLQADSLRVPAAPTSLGEGGYIFMLSGSLSEGAVSGAD